jgi:hypothetical protein
MGSTPANDQELHPGPSSSQGVTSLGAERWQRLKDLFAAALALPRSQRAAFVAGSCGQDAELHVRILELVRAAEVQDGFIERSAANRLD